MSDELTVATESKTKILVGGSIAAILAVGIVGFIIFSAVCPCERTPGGFLFVKAMTNPFLTGRSLIKYPFVNYRYTLAFDLIQLI